MSDTNQNDAQPQADLQTSFAARTTNVGDVVVGKLVKITGSVAFIDYGARSEGYIELSELKDDTGEVAFKEGDQVEAEVVSIRGAVQLSRKNLRAAQMLESLKVAWKNQTPVEGKIVGVNKGGYELRIEGVRAFCPNSQMDVRFVHEPKTMVGQTHTFRITEYGDGKSLVVSRRVLLEAGLAEKRAEMGASISVGDVKQGKVTQVRDFGAFVDLGEGLEGLIHVSEISHERINKPSDVLNVGDAVEVKVIRVEPERGRIALSIKQLEDNPWTTFVDGLEVGQKMTGVVERLQPFGAFIKLAPGIDGLLHVSAITTEKRIEHPSELLTEGEEIEVVVEKIERDRQRIGLMTPMVAERRKPVDVKVRVNDVVKGAVTRTERFGVFINVEGTEILIPNAEMATDRGTDHRRMFPIGTELEAKIIEVDRKRNRIRASRKRMLTHAEEQAVSDYKKRSEANQSMGTFGDLLKDFLNK